MNPFILFSITQNSLSMRLFILEIPQVGGRVSTFVMYKSVSKIVILVRNREGDGSEIPQLVWRHFLMTQIFFKLSRSDEQLNRAETSQLIRQGSIEKSRPLSASLSGDRKPSSSESVTHVTRIRVEKEVDQLPAETKTSKKGKQEEKDKDKSSKDKEKKKEKDKKKEKEKEKKQKEKEKEKDKKKKKKKEEESSKKRRPR